MIINWLCGIGKLIIGGIVLFAGSYTIIDRVCDCIETWAVAKYTGLPKDDQNDEEE